MSVRRIMCQDRHSKWCKFAMLVNGTFYQCLHCASILPKTDYERVGISLPILSSRLISA